jgi:dephospho-CoA kinase
MIVIGLTGGIGTGKSVVSDMLAEKGAVILNADKVGHEAYEPGTEAYHDLISTFGREILDENERIDRKKLGAIVFADPQALQKLNQIVHPRMYKMMEERLAQLREQGVKVVVLEAAILIEAHWTPLVDQVWVVTAAEDTVVQRLVNRNNMTPEQAMARIKSQLPEAERLKHASAVVDNNGSLAEARRQVEALWHKIQSEPGVGGQN